MDAERCGIEHGVALELQCRCEEEAEEEVVAEEEEEAKREGKSMEGLFLEWIVEKEKFGLKLRELGID